VDAGAGPGEVIKSPCFVVPILDSDAGEGPTESIGEFPYSIEPWAFAVKRNA